MHRERAGIHPRQVILHGKQAPGAGKPERHTHHGEGAIGAQEVLVADLLTAVDGEAAPGKIHRGHPRPGTEDRPSGLRHLRLPLPQRRPGNGANPRPLRVEREGWAAENGKGGHRLPPQRRRQPKPLQKADALARQPPGAHLRADLGVALQHQHLAAGLGQRGRRLQAGRTGAHHHKRHALQPCAPHGGIPPPGNQQTPGGGQADPAASGPGAGGQAGVAGAAGEREERRGNPAWRAGGLHGEAVGAPRRNEEWRCAEQRIGWSRICVRETGGCGPRPCANWVRPGMCRR